jgi:hypothetical protein
MVKWQILELRKLLVFGFSHFVCQLMVLRTSASGTSLPGNRRRRRIAVPLTAAARPFRVRFHSGELLELLKGRFVSLSNYWNSLYTESIGESVQQRSPPFSARA